jgi:hypothetical protein
MSVGRYLTTRYLTDDVQHILAKCPRLFWRHLIRIVAHFNVLAGKVTNNLAQILPIILFFSYYEDIYEKKTIFAAE